MESNKDVEELRKRTNHLVDITTLNDSQRVFALNVDVRPQELSKEELILAYQSNEYINCKLAHELAEERQKRRQMVQAVRSVLPSYIKMMLMELSDWQIMDILSIIEDRKNDKDWEDD